MPVETNLPAKTPMHSEPAHQLPVRPPPTPHLFPNSLELHIPIPIPTPPTPLPIAIAYPLSQSPFTTNSENSYSNRDAVQADDSGLELEPVPAPMQANNLGAELSTESEEVPHDPTFLDSEFELVDVSEEELQRLDAQEKTINLFRALNVPLNIHKLRAMRARGKLPAPLLKFKYGASRAKALKSSVASGKENKEVHLTSILKVSGSTLGSGEQDPLTPTEMETVQGESWYLPSATARRMIRRRVNRKQPEQGERDWEHAHEREMIQSEESPGPVIPNHILLDQFPLPPSSFPFTSTRPDPYTTPLPPTPLPTPSSSSRPLGYMYAPAKPLGHIPSCKSCGGSPAYSLASSRTLTPGPPPEQGCYYAYDLLTPSPGALPYAGFGSAQSVSPKRSVSASTVPMAPQHSY